MSHPHESLAEYVDGTLPSEERAEVDAHLVTCPACRTEVDLARRASAALGALPGVPVPAGTVRPGLGRHRERTRVGRRRPRAEWIAGLAAAASIAAIFALVALSKTAPPQNTAAPGAERGGAVHRADLGPVIVRSSADFDATSIRRLADTLAHQLAPSGPNPAAKAGGVSGAGAAGTTTTNGGGASGGSSASNAEGASGGSADTAAQAGPQRATNPSTLNQFGAAELHPAACVRAAAGLPRSARPARIIEARFKGAPVYIGAFLQDGSSPDAIVLWVVSRSSCRVLSTVRQTLP